MSRDILLLVILVCMSFSVEGQGIRRSVICSMGTSQSGGLVKIKSTFGQPPNAGTLSSGDNFLRQGFQQPLRFSTDPSNNCFLASFVVEEISTVCGVYFNMEYTGSVEGETSFLWDFGDDAVPSVSEEMNPERITFMTSGQKNIDLTVIQGECTQTVSAVIDIDIPGFVVSTDITKKLCFGDEVIPSIDLTVFQGTPPYEFIWSNGATEEDLTDLENGIYGFTVTDANGCVFFRDNLEVSEPSAPLTLSSSIVKDEICENTRDGEIDLEMNGGTPPYSFEWSDGGEEEAKRTNLSMGHYTVTVTDDNGCSITHDFRLDEFCNKEDSIPNVFTPNGDGANDTWDIGGLSLFMDSKLEIYNRWGSLVYETKGFSGQWDGTNDNGEDMPVGPYYYIIKLNDAEDTVFKGSVTIIR